MPALQQGWIDPSTDPQHPNWQYQIYADPNSQTGWSRRIWDPIGPSTSQVVQPYDFARDQAIANAADAKQAATDKANWAQANADQQQLAKHAKTQDAATAAAAKEDRDRYDQNRKDLLSGRQATAIEAQKVRDAGVKAAKLLADENHRQFDLNYGLNTRTEAARENEAAAQNRGALNYYQGQAEARGFMSLGAGGVPQYLTTLASGGNPGISGGTATTGNPVPLTPATMAAGIANGTGGAANTNGTFSGFGASGAGGSGGTDAYGRPLLSQSDQNSLGTISTIAQKGLANLPLGSVESLSPGELAAYKSGSDYLGRSTDDDLNAYSKSRPGQGLSSLG